MKKERPLACDLSASKTDEREKHKNCGEQVFASVEDVKELSEGYALRLPAETSIIEQAGAFIARERLCCSFFDFSLEVSSGHGPVWLKLEGSGQVKKFIAQNVIPHLAVSE